MSQVPKTGDRIKVIKPVPPWYFRGEHGVVTAASPDNELVEIVLAGTRFPRIAHPSHLEVLQ